MISGRWVAIIVVAFAVICGGVALAVLGGDGRNATTMGSVGGGGDLTGVAATDTASPASDAGTTLLDPAKQEPILDLFTAKDPFAPLGGFSPEPTPTPTPTETVSPDEPLSADVTIGGIPDTVVAGDETPLDDPAFYVADVTSSGVTFELIDGQTFDDGSSSVEVAEGQEVVVTTADTGESFRISVVSLNYGDDDGGDDDGGAGGGGDDGHTVELRSINTQNGVDTATIAVDGVTYADLEVGDQVDTDWGQIKVLAIDPGAQTVTILHGDDTLVLRVGQSIEK